MEIKYFNKINGSSSVIKDYAALENVQRQVSDILNSRLQGYADDCTLPLMVTLIANPKTESLTNAHKHSDRLWSIISNELASDGRLYVVRALMGQIFIPVELGNVLIAIGLKEFKETSEASESTHGGEDDERPEFKVKEPKWRLDDVILDENTRYRVLRAMSIIENKNLIFKEWGFELTDKSTKSIVIFYGAAGTGKTMTAEAIASYLKKPIVHSSYAEIESQYVGVGAKNLRAIFEFAEQNDAVLFFDEADSFLSNRIKNTEHGSDKHYNRMSNELFQLLEDFNGCVVFATNLLTDVDEAFKSRVQPSAIAGRA